MLFLTVYGQPIEKSQVEFDKKSLLDMYPKAIKIN